MRNAELKSRLHLIHHSAFRVSSRVFVMSLNPFPFATKLTYFFVY